MTTLRLEANFPDGTTPTMDNGPIAVLREVVFRLCRDPRPAEQQTGIITGQLELPNGEVIGGFIFGDLQQETPKGDN